MRYASKGIGKWAWTMLWAEKLDLGKMLVNATEFHLSSERFVKRYFPSTSILANAIAPITADRLPNVGGAM